MGRAKRLEVACHANSSRNVTRGFTSGISVRREACDLGMFTQTVMLGITANGLGSCPQTALGFMAHAIKPALNIPEDQKLLFGLSFGYPNDDDPANKAMTDRASLEDIVRFNA